MVWGLTAPQCFFIVIIAFGILGIYRGWKREIVSTAFVLGTILFLSFTHNSLAQFFFVNVPHAAVELTTGTSTQQTTQISANDPRTTITVAIFFLVVVTFGYFISIRAMPKATTPAGHILGVIPGIVTGSAILYFVTSALGTASLVSLDIKTPDQSVIGSNLLVLFLIAVAAVVISLIAVSTKKKSSPSSPKKP